MNFHSGQTNLNRLFAYLVPGTLIAFLLFLHSAELNSVKGPAGIEISTVTQKGMFPSNWLKPPINAKAISLSVHRRNASVQMAQESLTKYPANLIGSRIKHVFILDDLWIYDKSASGTFSDQSIYIKNFGLRYGNCDWMERKIHTSLARIFKKHNSFAFDEKAWLLANAKDFEYGKGENAKVKDGDAEVSTADPENGFLCQYAKTSVSADFSMTSGFLFSGYQRIWDLAEKFPRIKQKLDLTIKFYNNIDPSLNRDFFLNLSKKRKKPCC